MKIFTRTKKGTQLTETGEEFYAMTVEILSIYEVFEKKISQNQNEIKKMYIDTSWYVANNLIVDAVSMFCEIYPKIDVRITEHSTAKLILKDYLDFR